MSRFAAQLIELAIRHFPAALLPKGADEILRRSAPLLAPGRSLYFECRLAGGDRSIDVSQHFFAQEDGATGLRALAEERAAIPDGAEAVWASLATLARLWESDAVLADVLAEIGLEHDQAGGDWVAAPAVFAALKNGALADRAVVERFLETVSPDALPAWEQAVSALQLAERCGMASGRLVGVMLSRGTELRCMVRGLTPDRIAAFLDVAGGVDPDGHLATLLAQDAFTGDAPRLVLGFGPSLAPEFGIEVIHTYDAAGIAARDALTRWAVDAGTADPERAAALALWPDAITPADARADWPDAMIAAELSGHGGATHLSCFINHLKFSVAPGKPVSAKAYLALAPMGIRGGADA